jgi:CheY-like chemotaxis protein
MAKVLVIDDDVQLCDVLRLMLTHEGHKVMLTHDGVEGINVFKDLKPDLVITDIIMPNKDGIQVITELMALNPYIPVIAMSGGRRSVTAEFNLESAGFLGVKSILSKPFTREQLREALKNALG